MRSLRLSVTDRCNLRCSYCMPEERYVWLPREELCDFDELCRLVDVAVALGVDRVRLTGGEPLLRRDLPLLARKLASRRGLADVALTTNGLLLDALARPLREAGVRRLTVSLDTLRRDRFVALTRRDALPAVVAGIAAARAAGFDELKIDTVVLRGENDDEVVPLLGFGREVGAEVRFIEYMDVGGATRWHPERVVGRAELLSVIAQKLGPAEPLAGRGASPAERFRLPDGTTFGIVGSVTAPFCRACDRARLTADGMWYPCLYALRGLDLKSPLRAGASDAELTALLGEAWRAREDRGAELRAGLPDRGVLVPLSRLRGDPHLEMHTRGG
jgi:cyclic pyranopterin phosphate synthase